MVTPTPGLPIEQQPEPVILRMCLWAEARGEPHIGKLAILYVLENRAVKRDTTMKAEVLRPKQFSSFNDDDPNRPLLLDAFHHDPSGWAACDAVCGLYECKGTLNPIGPATHYYNPSVVQPAWGRGSPSWFETGSEGHHVFGIAP